MHELSVVLGIVDIAIEQAAREQATVIEEIELDIGCLSTVEMNAFEMAWKQGVKNTLLENAVKKVNRISGKAMCLECNIDFEISNLYDPCPVCAGHLIHIIQGKELRVVSLVISSIV